MASATLAATVASGLGAVGASAPLGAASPNKPITVGGVYTESQFPGVDTGFQARVAAQNRAGGVDGHQIHFVGVRDDGGSPATDLDLVNELVLRDHVAAIAPVISVEFLSSSASFAAANKTPFVGWGIGTPFCGSKWGYGFNGCLEGTTVLNTSLVDPIIKEMGGHPSNIRVANIGNDTSVAKVLGQLYKKLFAVRGAKVVYNQNTMPTTAVTNYVPYVQAILQAHPNLVLLNVTFTQTAGLVAALRAAGYTGVSMDYQTYVPGLLAAQPAVASALQGEYVDTQIPPQESHSPATAQIEKDLEAIGQPKTISMGQQVGYWSADVLIHMLQATAAAHRPLTGSGIEQTVNGGFTYKGAHPGGIGPISFPRGERYPTPCAALLQVKGDQYHTAEPFACYADIPVRR